MTAKRLGVIGWPIAHSRSPKMHAAAIGALGIDFTYEAFAVEPQDLEAMICDAYAQGIVGLNVTIPHKERVLALCDADEIARAVGAVNTLSFEGDAIRGTNTDVYGFDQMRRGIGVPDGARTVILGQGGAAKAVAHAMRQAGAEVTMVARRPASQEIAPWNAESLRALFANARLLVDATPRGLSDEADPSMPLEHLPADAAVCDLVVRASTPIVAHARSLGLRAETGAEMLLYQGARSLEIWTGLRAPIEVMRAALDV